MPSKKEYEDEDTLVIRNIAPKAEIHLLIIPKKHVNTFLDLGNEMNKLVQAAQKVIKRMGVESGYKMLINGGRYQQVPHFHLHLLAGKLESNKEILEEI